MATYEDPENDPKCDPALALVTAFIREAQRRDAGPADGLRAAISLAFQTTIAMDGDIEGLCDLMRKHWARLGDEDQWKNIPARPLGQRAQA